MQHGNAAALVHRSLRQFYDVGSIRGDAVIRDKRVTDTHTEEREDHTVRLYQLEGDESDTHHECSIAEYNNLVRHVMPVQLYSPASAGKRRGWHAEDFQTFDASREVDLVGVPQHFGFNPMDRQSGRR